MAIFNSYVSLPEGKSRDFLGSIPRFRREKHGKTVPLGWGEVITPQQGWDRLGPGLNRLNRRSKLEDPKDV